ncbi:hypothetical protein TNIN_372871 [Trichonephila inaurata madagascariensis]|uniref:Uncharacterized protein n=1 Tax=Trichonephila inaurata madagascariensis TaxID=2747483 RepID=A0A8X6YD17_9ARAC|nr:hypothetical protein TNIN_372871 [Trichonephila inaurata madagascariensis]
MSSEASTQLPVVGNGCIIFVFVSARNGFFGKLFAAIVSKCRVTCSANKLKKGTNYNSIGAFVARSDTRCHDAMLAASHLKCRLRKRCTNSVWARAYLFLVYSL